MLIQYLDAVWIPDVEPQQGVSVQSQLVGWWFGLGRRVRAVPIVEVGRTERSVARWFEVWQARAKGHSQKAVWMKRSAFPLVFGV